MRELRGLGLTPDLIVCRSEKAIGDSAKQKISNFCHVKKDQVIIKNIILLCQRNQYFVIEDIHETLNNTLFVLQSD